MNHAFIKMLDSMIEEEGKFIEKNRASLSVRDVEEVAIWTNYYSGRVAGLKLAKILAESFIEEGRVVEDDGLVEEQPEFDPDPGKEIILFRVSYRGKTARLGLEPEVVDDDGLALRSFLDNRLVRCVRELIK